MIGAFNDNCVLSFFKGALLQDEQGILEFPGENSQSAKFARFTDAGSIRQLEDTLKSYIFEAIEVEKAGLKVDFKKNHATGNPGGVEGKICRNPCPSNGF